MKKILILLFFSSAIYANINTQNLTTLDFDNLEFTLSKNSNSIKMQKNVAPILPKKTKQTQQKQEIKTIIKYIPVYVPIKIPVYQPVFIPKYIPVRI